MLIFTFYQFLLSSHEIRTKPNNDIMHVSPCTVSYIFLSQGNCLSQQPNHGNLTVKSDPFQPFLATQTRRLPMILIPDILISEMIIAQETRTLGVPANQVLNCSAQAASRPANNYHSKYQKRTASIILLIYIC